MWPIPSPKDKRATPTTANSIDIKPLTEIFSRKKIPIMMVTKTGYKKWTVVVTPPPKYV